MKDDADIDERAANEVWNGEKLFSPDLFRFFSGEFLNAIQTAFKSDIRNIDTGFAYNAPEDVFRTAMETNLYHFSAAKTLAEIQELNRLFRESGSYVWKPSEKTQAQAAPAEARPQSQPCEPQLPSEPPLPEGEPEQLDLFEQRLLNPATKSDIRIIGQLFDTYWLVQFEDKFYMIDQHAAHEKVLYERTLKSLADKEITSQMVSPPLILTLSMQEAEKLSAYQDYFRELGFEIEPFGGKEYAVSAVPANLYGLAEKDLFLELLDGLEYMNGRNTQMILEKIASMSCKAAVKGNQRMSAAEAKALIEELLTLENPYNCPHGRPTIISMTKQEIEKKFKRIV